MPLHEQGFDCFPVVASAQFAISYPTLDIDGSIEISMHPQTADLTTKRLLIRPVLLVHIMTSATFLGGIGALDTGCLHPSLGGIPCDLFGNMRKVGGTHVGIHGSRLMLHRRHGKALIRELCLRMLGKALIHGAVDLLLHMPDEAMPALTTGRRKLLDPLLFQALAQFGFAT